MMLLDPFWSNALSSVPRILNQSLRGRMDALITRLVCPDTLRTEEEIQRLRALLGRFVGLDSLTLSSWEAVGSAFNEDGSPAFNAELKHLVINLEEVRTLAPSGIQHLPSCLRKGEEGEEREEGRKPIQASGHEIACKLILFMSDAVQEITQDQLDFLCQLANSRPTELSLKRPSYFQDLDPLALCTQLVALDLINLENIKDSLPWATSLA